MMNLRFQFLKLSLCVFLLTFCGCGRSGNLGTVEGVVTIDGKPIDQASIGFYPAEGRASVGYTNKNGYYTLGYTRTEKGAVIGDHKVIISTELTRDFNPSDRDALADGDLRKEVLSPKYNDLDTTDLTATVVAGNNVIDFKLESE